MRSAWIAVLFACALSACRSLSAPAAGTERSGTWYTQFALQFEKGRFRTTNYRRGIVLPVNTEVTFRSLDSDSVTVEVKSTGQQLIVENVPKHTGQTVDQAFDRIFGRQPLDLSQFTQAERDAIRDGRAEVGMSRNAVLAASGYPPAIGTPSLESNDWKYWDSRFTTFVVHFADGSVQEIRS